MNFNLRWIAKALNEIRSLGDAPATPLLDAAAAYDERPLDRDAGRRFRARLDRVSIDAEKNEIVRILRDEGPQKVVCGCVITLRALTELTREGRIVECIEAGRITVRLAEVH